MGETGTAGGMFALFRRAHQSLQSLFARAHQAVRTRLVVSASCRNKIDFAGASLFADRAAPENTGH